MYLQECLERERILVNLKFCALYGQLQVQKFNASKGSPHI